MSKAIVSEVLGNHQLKNVFVKTKKSALEMIRIVKLKSVVEDFEFILGFAEKQTNVWEQFTESLQFIDGFALRHNKKMICAFDEFGDLGKFVSIARTISNIKQTRRRLTAAFRPVN